MRHRLAAVCAALCLFASAEAQEPVTIRFNVDPIGKAFQLNKEMAAEFEKQNPDIKVELIAGPIDATERLAQYSQLFAAQSPDVDVLQVDVIWPGTVARHLVDLTAEFHDYKKEFFPPIAANNTIRGKFIAVPWYADAGVLYYRSDLLKKYGFDAPPKTYDELETMAAKIQAGEREAGNANFHGFVFQAASYEGLTCNAIEWQAAHGGGTIIDGEGKVTVNNPQAIAAFTRARKWIGTIAPAGVTTYREEECRGIFQGGNAAFMRNWPYAWALCNADDSAVKGKFDITVLPDGGGGHAAALGGWQLAVSKYSKHPKEAIRLVRFMTSPEIQKQRAIKGGLLASRVALYDDPEINKVLPYFASMKDVFLNSTPRPSGATGRNYNQVSTEYFQTVSKILTGEKEAAPALKELETKLTTIMSK